MSFFQTKNHPENMKCRTMDKIVDILGQTVAKSTEKENLFERFIK